MGGLNAPWRQSFRDVLWIKLARTLISKAEKEMVGRGVNAYEREPRSGFRQETDVAVSGRALHLGVRRFAENLQGNSAEILINKTRLQKLAVQFRSAFTEQPLYAVFRPQQPHHRRKVQAITRASHNNFWRSGGAGGFRLSRKCVRTGACCDDPRLNRFRV